MAQKVQPVMLFFYTRAITKGQMSNMTYCPLDGTNQKDNKVRQQNHKSQISISCDFKNHIRRTLFLVPKIFWQIISEFSSSGILKGKSQVTVWKNIIRSFFPTLTSSLRDMHCFMQERSKGNQVPYWKQNTIRN